MFANSALAVSAEVAGSVTLLACTCQTPACPFCHPVDKRCPCHADNARSDSLSLGGAKGGGPSSAEALLAFLVAEFGDGRSIAAVVPLRARLAALEPELLGLSPEQAEDTQL